MSTHTVTSETLDDKVAVVTGASKGIGHGIASALVDAGANVVLVARGEGELKGAKDELQERARPGRHVFAVQADVADSRSVAGLFAIVDEQAGGLDVFVANAGSGKVTPYLDLSDEEWNATVGLNLTGTHQCVQAAARRMVAARASGDRGDKSILVVSSIRATGVRPGRLVYSVTKAAVNQLVRSAAYELAGLGVRVNVVSPGITATPLAVEGNPEVFAEMVAMVPMGRAGTPDDMAAAAVYLCSPQARFVTGANIVVDGGESLW